MGHLLFFFLNDDGKRMKRNISKQIKNKIPFSNANKNSNTNTSANTSENVNSKSKSKRLNERSIQNELSNKLFGNINRIQNKNHTIHGVNVKNIINYLPISKKLVFIILILI